MNKMLMGTVIALGLVHAANGSELRLKNTTLDTFWIETVSSNYEPTQLTHLRGPGGSLKLDSPLERLRIGESKTMSIYGVPGGEAYNFAKMITVPGKEVEKINKLIGLPFVLELVTDQNKNLNIVFPSEQEIKEAQAKKVATPAQKESKPQAELATIKAQLSAKNDELTNLKNALSKVKDIVTAVKL